MIGIRNAIETSFKSVFSDLNVYADVWFSQAKLSTVGRDKYISFII